MEQEGSLPCSQRSTSGPFPEPDASSPHPSTLFPQDPFSYYLSVYANSFQVASSFRFSNQNIVCISHLSRFFTV